jgi:hypothetical protein
MSVEEIQSSYCNVDVNNFLLRIHRR